MLAHTAHLHSATYIHQESHTHTNTQVFLEIRVSHREHRFDIYIHARAQIRHLAFRPHRFEQLVPRWYYREDVCAQRAGDICGRRAVNIARGTRTLSGASAVMTLRGEALGAAGECDMCAKPGIVGVSVAEPFLIRSLRCDAVCSFVSLFLENWVCGKENSIGLVTKSSEQLYK